MTTLAAVQETLAAEHAAVYVYGALGAQTSQSGDPQLYAALVGAYAVHRARRDQLTSTVTDVGGEPVAASPSYVLPERLDTPERISRVARGLEEGCAETYASMVANTSGARRRWAITALNDAAVRVLAFRGTPEMLPGSGEYADR